MATYVVGVLIQIAAAVWVFWVAPGDPRNRSFSVLVSLNAVWDLLEGLYFFSEPPRDAYYLRVYTYLAIWTSAALVWFLSLYPVKRRYASVAGWTALLVALGLSAWFATDHAAAESPVFTLLSLAWTPLLCLGAFIVLRVPIRRPNDPRAWSMVLVACALLVYPLSQAVTMASAAYWPYLLENLTSPSSPQGAADAIVEAAYLLARLGAVVLAVLAIHATTRQQGGARRKVIFVSSLLGAVVLVRTLETVGFVVPPINALVFGVILAYALARAHLFDIDLRLKVTLSHGSVVAVFTFVFIMVSQTMQAFFEQEFGQNYVIAGVACGLLLFALAPLERWAGRLAHHALPKVERTPSYERFRRRDIYLGALADAWHDGSITVKERRLLDALARQLGLDAGEAAGLESQVVGQLPTARKTGPQSA